LGLVPDIKDLKAWALFEQASSNEVANFEAFARVLVYEKVFKA
jgi:glutathione S-transferase